MLVTFKQFLVEKLSQEQPPGTSDLSGSGVVTVSGSSPRTAPAKPDYGSRIISGVSPEKLFGKKGSKK